MNSYLLVFFLSLSTTFFMSDSVHVVNDSLAQEGDSLRITELADSVRTDTTVSVLKAEPLVYPVVPNNAFSVGEKLTFKVRYGFIRAGTATMTVKGIKTVNDHEVYHIQTTAESASGFSWIYKVEDVVDSYLDLTGLFSWKFDKRLREGGYKVDLFVDYLPDDSLADISFTRYESDMTVREKQNYQVKTPPFSRDVLASFYYIRTQPLETGRVFRVTNHDNKKVYELEVHVYRREIVETAAGTFHCFVVEPLLKGEGIFKQKGTLQVWMTDDKYKIPVQMKSEVFVGHITTELEEIDGINEPIPARMNLDE